MSEPGNQLISLKNNASKRLFNMVMRGFSPISALALAEYTRWVLWFPVFIGLGIGLYFSLPVEPSLPLGVITMATCAAAAYLGRRKSGLFQPLAILFSICLGLVAAQARTIGVDDVVLTREIGPTRVVGRVIQVEPKTTGARLLLESVTIGGLEPFVTPYRVRVTARFDDAEAVSPGDWIQVRAVLRPPAAPVAPGAFDFQRHAFFKQIGATGYTYGPPEIRQHWQDSTTTNDLGAWLARIRLATGDRIRSTLPGETGALAAALITGERLAIPEDAVTAMRNAGLAHLLAISGLHIGLVAGLVFFLIRAGFALFPNIALHHPIKVWAAIAALGAAFCYTLLAGATIPTLRSFIMMALVLAAVMIGRRAISMRSVALAASIVLLLRPESLLGPSFQLSFAAVTALVAVYEWLSGHMSAFWKQGNWFQRSLAYLSSVALSTLVAGAATAPFAAFHFHQLASYGMLANLIAVPLTALCIMPSALMAVFLMPFGFETLPLDIMGLGIEGLLATARTVAALPGNLQVFSVLPMAALITITLGGLWLCLWCLKWRMIGAIAIVIGVMIASVAETPVILASENGEIFAIQTAEGLLIVGPGVRGNRYTQAAWLERAGYGRSEQPAKQEQEEKTENAVRCDHMGCVVIANGGQHIAVVWDEGALLEDCWTADILVSAVLVRRRCDVPLAVIDRFDLWRNGAYAIYIEGRDMRIEHTRQIRGDRPWTRAANRTQSKIRNPES